jgi:formylglycine-generating enzyme required for sulfatase activity
MTEATKDQSEFIDIKGAMFMMGTPKVQGQKYIPHEVKVNSFKMSKYLITIRQFKAFLDAYQGDKVKQGEGQGKPLLENHKGFKKSSNVWLIKLGYEEYPVSATWYGANEYCKHYGYRLPTEAEWEYAAKGGVLSQGFLYSGSHNMDVVAWHRDSVMFKEFFPIGQKAPNELGLFDMSGLKSEWCNDWYNKRYYTESPEDNPQGPDFGKQKVRRGGSTSVFYPKSFLIVCFRDPFYPDVFSEHTGFRPVINWNDTNVNPEVSPALPPPHDPKQNTTVPPPYVPNQSPPTPRIVINKSENPESKNGTGSIIFGVVLLLGGIIATAASEGEVLFYGAVAVGIGLIIKGIINNVK